jgi:hypothetical protein
MMGYRGGFLAPCNTISLSVVKGVEFLEQVTDCCLTKVFDLGASYAFVTYHCHHHY